MESLIPISECIGSDGRYVCRMADGASVRKARLVMMNYLHTSRIPTRIHIHHINGIKTDDRLENLEMLFNRDHVSSHMNPLQIPRAVRRHNNNLKYNSKASSKARVKAWKAANKEHVYQEYRKRYVSKHDEIMEYHHNYYLQNKERICEYARQYKLRKKQGAIQDNGIRQDKGGR